MLLSTFSQRTAENARRAKDELFGLQNARKALMGRHGGPAGSGGDGSKAAEEKALRDAVAKRPELAAAATAWDDVAASLGVLGEIYDDYALLERGAAFNSELFGIARTLVRMAEETAKPNGERLREYRDSNLESLRQQLFSEAPIYGDLETVKLADSLGMYEEMAGAEIRWSSACSTAARRRSRAAALVGGTKLGDVALRKQLAEGGTEAIRACDDPMIRLARLVDPAARSVRKIEEEKVEEPQRQAYAKIADARFAVLGTNVYPDATFTLRLAFGTVKGYTESGRRIPPWTTIAGLYRRAAEHAGEKPFELPDVWVEAKDRLLLGTPMNFVVDRRHHRRELGQPGGRPRGPTGRIDLRRKPPVAGLGLPLHVGTRPRHRRRQQSDHRGAEASLRGRCLGGGTGPSEIEGKCPCTDGHTARAVTADGQTRLVRLRPCGYGWCRSDRKRRSCRRPPGPFARRGRWCRSRFAGVRPKRRFRS